MLLYIPPYAPQCIQAERVLAAAEISPKHRMCRARTVGGGVGRQAKAPIREARGISGDLRLLHRAPDWEYVRRLARASKMRLLSRDFDTGVRHSHIRTEYQVTLEQRT